MINAILNYKIITKGEMKMKLLVFVLNNTEKLESFLTEFAYAGIGGATVLSSTGMARVLTSHDDNEEDIPLFNALRSLLNPEREKSNTIFTVLPDEQVPTAIETIERVVGDLNNKDTGIVFTLPIDFVKGLPHLE